MKKNWLIILLSIASVVLLILFLIKECPQQPSAQVSDPAVTILEYYLAINAGDFDKALALIHGFEEMDEEARQTRLDLLKGLKEGFEGWGGLDTLKIHTVTFRPTMYFSTGDSSDFYREPLIYVDGQWLIRP